MASVNRPSDREHQQKPFKPPSSPQRIDTQHLKAQLASILGNHGQLYWTALIDFCTAKISRQEFQEVAQRSLRPEHMHYHNALILGILFNATADVPGPSNSRKVSGAASRKRDAGLGADGYDSDDAEPSRKRLRQLVAGLPKKERIRLKNIGKPVQPSPSPNSGAASVGWAGAGADLLEKKRKEEERRRAAEDKKKVRELTTELGSSNWKTSTLKASSRISAAHDKLATSTQQCIQRGQAALLCSESKELPDVDALQDRMTLQAVDAGLSGGVHPQAAAMVLAALQGHLQNVASRVIGKVRSNRATTIRTSEPSRPAADFSSKYYAMCSSPNRNLSDLAERNASPQTDSAPNSPIRSLRTVPSDLSSRASTSMLGTSFADASMLSIASTAPTSFINGSASEGSAHADDDEKGVAEVDHQTTDRHDRSSQRETKLSLRDMSFHFALDPHSAVEPYSLANVERLLAPDRIAPEQSPHCHPTDLTLARAAKAAATSKLASADDPRAASHRSRFVVDAAAPLRVLDRRTLAETQSAGQRPTKGGLMLSSTSSTHTDRQDPLADTTTSKPYHRLAAFVGQQMEASADSGESAKRKAHKDDLWDVADPVALLGPLCD